MVLLDLPVVFDLDLAAAGRMLPYRWMPEAGARVGVLPRDGSGADVRWIGIDPVFVFHVLNAFDDGDRIVLDVVRYDSAFDTPPGGAVASSHPVLARWTIDPEVGRVTQQQLDDTPVEFPRIDDAVAGRQHRYGYLLGFDTPMPATPRRSGSTTSPTTRRRSSTAVSTGSPASRCSSAPPTATARTRAGY